MSKDCFIVALWRPYPKADENLWVWGICELPRPIDEECRGMTIFLSDLHLCFTAKGRRDSMEEAFEAAKSLLSAIGSGIEKLPVYCESDSSCGIMHECRIEDGRLVLPDDISDKEE